MNRGQLTLVARLHAEQRSRSEESCALSTAQDALAHAHESIVQLVLERDGERRARVDAEARVSLGRHGRDAAMRALQQAIRTLRKLKTEAAERESERETVKALAETERRARGDAEKRALDEHRAREEAVRQLRDVRSAAEEQARAFARLETRCGDMTTQLNKLEAALAQAEYVVFRQSLQHAELEAALDDERRARIAAQNDLVTLQHACDEAARALSDCGPSRLLKKLRLTDR